MDKKQVYIISTVGYVLVALVGVIGVLYFTLFSLNLFLVFLSLVIIGVCLDNIFCASRAKRAGVKAPSKHWFIPWKKK